MRSFFKLSLSLSTVFFLRILLVSATPCPPSGSSNGDSGLGSTIGLFGNSFFDTDSQTIAVLLFALFLLLVAFAVVLLLRREKAVKTLQQSPSKPIQNPLNNFGEARIQQPNGAYTTTPLHYGRNTIGRNPDNDLHLIDPKASSIHADIEISDGKYVISDLNSGNGTKVNGEEIIKRELYQGDIIEIGDSRIIL